MTIERIMKGIRNIPIWSLVLIIMLGTVLIRPSPARAEEAHIGHSPEVASKPEIEYWTCGMHPSVNVTPEQYEKGSTKCPICFMDLVPVYKEAGPPPEEGAPVQLTLGARARRLAGIETTPVERLGLFKEIYTVGTVTYDESRVALVSAWTGGRIDRLFVDFTGVKVKKGEHLVWIYSPQLITAQEEYLLALQASPAPGEGYAGAEELLKASRRKLLRLGLTEEQINKLERERKVQDHITIYAPIGGTVIKKHALEGMYVKEGEPIYHMADLSELWVMVDVYEYELGWVRLYQEVEITSPAFPGETFIGKVVFIDPFLNPKTRTAKARINLPNPDFRFKPEMYVNARIRVPLKEFGMILEPGLIGKYICSMHPDVVSDEAGNCPKCGMDLVKVEPDMVLAEKYTCPMHPEVVSDKPGNCPKCGMFLEKAAALPGKELALAIPKSAVLETGRRRIVWLDEGKGRYVARVVTLGPEAYVEVEGKTETYYPVLSGLKEGEKVVTRGNFLIDSQSQLTGAAAAAYGGALGEQEAPARPPGHQH